MRPRTARPRRRLAAALTAFLLPLGALVGLASPAQAAPSATATYQKTSDWGSGFEGTWTVKNTGTTALSGWRVAWDFPGGTRVTSAWDAEVSNSGNRWTAVNKSYNGSIAPGASVSFAFNGSGGGSPSACTLNGAPCDGSGGGGGNDTPPTAPGALRTGTITDSSVALSWSAATDDKGVSGYQVLRNGTKVADVTGTSHTDTGLQSGTDYTYTVKAKDTAGQTGPASSAVQARTTGSTGGGGGPSGDHINLGYFIEWGTYDRKHDVKDLVTSGSAEKLTHINYAFGNVTGGRCTMGDGYAATDKAFTADRSVDGKADTWDQPLRGHFNQLKKLKAQYPHIKILWSFGGWTWSGGFGDAMKNPAAFAKSCNELVNDPRWAGVFDGIDLDWEYPNACGLSCDGSGPGVIKTMMQAFRAEFGQDQLLTAAITADASSGGKIDKADYAGAAQYVDWYNVMTYDYFGAFDADGPTAPHSALSPYTGIPQEGFTAQESIAKLKAKGVPASKLLLGIGFYGRGWTGVTQSAPGGTATGGAPGTYEAGIEDYKKLKTSCPVTGTVGGTAYAHCGNNWWSYDTPQTIAGKMSWAEQQGLGGAFFWETSGDTADGELITAIHNGLN